MGVTITGTVTDNNGIVLQNALLTLKPVVSTLAPIQFTYSDASGNYSFTVSTQGTYQLTVKSSGIVYRHPANIPVATSNISNLNFAAVGQNANS